MQNERNATAIFSEIIANAKYEDFDQLLLDRMKIRIADGIGVTLAGVHGVGNDALLGMFQNIGGVQESSVFGRAVKLPAMHAAMLNSAQMRSNDFEPCHADNKKGPGNPAHIASSLNPTAFAVGERENASGKEVMTAIALGDDLGCRLTDSMGFDTDDVFDSTGTVNGMAACACAGRLNALSTDELRSAFSIVLSCLGGSMTNTREHSWLFKFDCSNCARNGVFAADLARCGYDRIDDPIGGKLGFFDMFGATKDIDLLLDQVGKKYYGEVTIKQYAGCCATHSAAKAALAATGSKPYDPSEIKEIRSHMLKNKVFLVGGLWEPGQVSQPFASFSVQGVACNLILHGSVFPEFETEEALGSEEFQAMLSKYVQIPDLEPDGDMWSIIEIELMDGTVLKGVADTIRPGQMTGKSPASMEFIKDKFMRNVKFNGSIPTAKAEEIWEICMNFEQLDNINKLIKLLVL